ncbi:hypothetical protein BGP75_00665 [Motiliproteus sp. MSK22-1]|nr:hypothetical protein BGP75_00665 [Motiliproteus sp. MSK22-1]
MNKQDVLLRDDRIINVADHISPLEAVRRINGSGKFLIPGLTDSHVHLSMVPGIGIIDLTSSAKQSDLQLAFTKQAPRSYLYFGVTQVLDLVASPESLELTLKQPLHPDVFHCGAVPTVNGYPLVFSELFSLDFFPYFVAETSAQVPAGYDPALHSPEAAITRIKKDGGRCVKVFVENGFGDQSHWPMPSSALLQRIQAAAEREGLPIYAHANAVDMQKIAIDLGVDVLAHGMWNWNQYTNNPGLPEDIRYLLDQVVEQGVAFQPTTRVVGGVRDLFDRTVLDDLLMKKVVPGELLSWYRTEDAQWFREEVRHDGLDNLPDNIIRNLFERRPISQGRRVIKYLTDKGHPLLLASDTPGNPSYANQPGLNSFLELRGMQQAGVALGAILQAATINNARVMGVEDDYGSVSSGKIANLLLLDKNPLETVEAYNSISQIILKGEVIERETLRAR